MKILVVDDVGYTRHFHTRLLQKAGHQSLSAGSGQEAIKILKSDHSIDLVLTDLMMADMDGIDLCQHVLRMGRMNDAGPIDPPKFILMTALHPGRNAQQRDIDRIALAKEIGFLEVLFKPLDQDELLQIIDRVAKGQARAPNVNVKAALSQVKTAVDGLLASNDPKSMNEFLDGAELLLLKLREASMAEAK